MVLNNGVARDRESLRSFFVSQSAIVTDFEAVVDRNQIVPSLYPAVSEAKTRGGVQQNNKKDRSDDRSFNANYRTQPALSGYRARTDC